MDYQKLINSNIKKLRQTHNLTQEEFAEKTGLSLQGVIKYRKKPLSA